MNLRLTTMTAAVALMFFTPIASYAQDIPLSPAPQGTVAPSAVDTKSDTYTQCLNQIGIVVLYSRNIVQGHANLLVRIWTEAM